METFVCLVAGLLLINLSGYYQGLFRERFIVRSWPIDRIVGMIFLLVFFIVYKFASSYAFIPLMIAAVGLGAYYHTMGAAQGAKASSKSLFILAIPPTEKKDRS